ncbi:hypothetical protein [Flavobacterium sp. fv08]|uniref:hypothetical protein n=1 Tax=Flavobacterium sp. fv08 TaxID=1761784 RepID=UPI0008D6FE68|nr:hypothetical protein [Flavobacterium sp. fv08]SEP06515.1 hypothetical protein SAMN04487978_4363 [Flavobacterium sp. fv08]
MEKNNTQYLIYIDILSIFKIAKDIQWLTIRQDSIYRILYLSSVLYDFRHKNTENPFSIYRFIIDVTGPYDSNISKAITFLLKDDYIERAEGEDVFQVGRNLPSNVFEFHLEEERIDWIKQIIYLLGIYGENKIYEFIFRDPQYQTTIKSNTAQGLNTDANNETTKTLELFKSAFEESLGSSINDISSQTYLELYFEYVFSKILKREE